MFEYIGRSRIRNPDLFNITILKLVVSDWDFMDRSISFYVAENDRYRFE